MQGKICNSAVTAELQIHYCPYSLSPLLSEEPTENSEEPPITIRNDTLWLVLLVCRTVVIALVIIREPLLFLRSTHQNSFASLAPFLPVIGITGRPTRRSADTPRLLFLAEAGTYQLL